MCDFSKYLPGLPLKKDTTHDGVFTGWYKPPGPGGIMVFSPTVMIRVKIFEFDSQFVGFWGVFFEVSEFYRRKREYVSNQRVVD